MIPIMAHGSFAGNVSPFGLVDAMVTRWSLAWGVKTSGEFSGQAAGDCEGSPEDLSQFLT